MQKIYFSIPLLVINTIFSLAIGFGDPVFSQSQGGNRALVYKRVVPPGITESVYIYDKKEVSHGVWQYRLQLQDDNNAPYAPQDWGEVNCMKSTMDGHLVTAVATSTADEGGAEIIRYLCGSRLVTY